MQKRRAARFVAAVGLLLSCESSSGDGNNGPVGANEWGCCLNSLYCLCEYGRDPSDDTCKRISPDRCTDEARTCCGVFLVDDGTQRCACTQHTGSAGDVCHLASNDAIETGVCPAMYPTQTCIEAGEPCGGAGDCCSGSLCIDYTNFGVYCGSLCTAVSQCKSGCCQPLDDGSASVCAPADWCSGTGGSGGSGGSGCGSCGTFGSFGECCGGAYCAGECVGSPCCY